MEWRFLKRLSGFYCLPYESRLAKLSLDSLYCERVKSDLVMCYKILNNLVSVDADVFFTLRSSTSTRDHSIKLYKQRTTSVRDANFFSNRTVNIWNSLPNDIVSSCSVAVFKRKLHPLCFSSV